MPATKLPIQKYLSANLFDEIGLMTLTPEERVSFLEGFGNVIQYRLTFRLMDELSEEQKKQLDQIYAEKNDPDAVMRFIVQEVPKFSEIAAEEIAKYKKELIERFKA